MWQLQNSPRKEISKETMKPNNRTYMRSYEWNYLVLDIVDYIESNLYSKKEGDDGWKLFQEYCAKHDLNWKVIKKMIEYSVVEVFNTEEELIKYDEFQPLKFKEDIVSEDKNNKEEEIVFNFPEDQFKNIIW
ncbi:MAG: hypothetical protein BWX72_01359 [Firmicutes bacterium ADurb.Bin080]|nr:MAG: hypothetical protein BWX72_01359 [Firmicutes bacterium ADurb.Bin080]